MPALMTAGTTTTTTSSSSSSFTLIDCIGEDVSNPVKNLASTFADINVADVSSESESERFHKLVTSRRALVKDAESKLIQELVGSGIVTHT